VSAINFVSNLPETLRTGGFSSMNASAAAALRARHDVRYAGPIDPPAPAAARAWSKLRRAAGRPGRFAFFSDARLRAIARDTERRLDPAARADVFHGFTPWVHVAGERPRIAVSDCTFRDYIGIFHRRETFDARDLARIEEAEARWLRGAAAVVLRSHWAAARAVRDYALDPAKVHVAPVCGEIAPPARDRYAGGRGFAFVATDFAAKGGPVVIAALGRVRARHPGVTLTIAGDAPADAAAEPGVIAAGMLRKEDPAAAARFAAILAGARAIVHPTRGDVSPLILVEAAYFGCPAVASRRFAIPELVEDGASGLLVDDPGDPAAVAAAMTRMLEDEAAYRRLRDGAWRRSRGLFSRERFETALIAVVDHVLAGAGAGAR
jgi:glycosyltransferase involved in cell wall biosynthesis